MRLDRFDLNLLVVFEAVYSETSLTKAAKRLNLAQPTVSNAIARLRAQCNDQLFIRSGRGLAPTPVAQRMITSVRQALNQIQTTLEGNLEFDPTTSEREFNISISEQFSSALLPPLMAHLQQAAPKIRLNTYRADRKSIKEALELGTLDFAIDALKLLRDSLNAVPLLADEYVCVLRRNHPEANQPMTLERFLNLQFISVSSRPTGSSLIEMALDKYDVDVQPALRTAFHSAAFRVIQATDYALITARDLASQHDVEIKKLPIQLSAANSWLYWHQNATLDPANKWLRSLILEFSK